MCGIAGFARAGADREPPAVLENMTSALRHRGPDDFGCHVDAYAALGHRRLSIIDLAAGHQPMANEDGSVWITYNGEIFNHAEVRPLLERAGHRYATRSDTETVIHAYEEFGPSCLQRFRGMFAFALWDSRRRTLWCARDRLGIKPFYYFWDGRLFAFASEIKALFEHPAVSPRLEESALPEQLAFGYTSGEQTLFSGICIHVETAKSGNKNPILKNSNFRNLLGTEGRTHFNLIFSFITKVICCFKVLLLGYIAHSFLK